MKKQLIDRYFVNDGKYVGSSPEDEDGKYAGGRHVDALRGPNPADGRS